MEKRFKDLISSEVSKLLRVFLNFGINGENLKCGVEIINGRMRILFSKEVRKEIRNDCNYPLIKTMKQKNIKFEKDGSLTADKSNTQRLLQFMSLLCLGRIKSIRERKSQILEKAETDLRKDFELVSKLFADNTKLKKIALRALYSDSTLQLMIKIPPLNLYLKTNNLNDLTNLIGILQRKLQKYNASTHGKCSITCDHQNRVYETNISITTSRRKFEISRPEDLEIAIQKIKNYINFLVRD